MAKAYSRRGPKPRPRRTALHYLSEDLKQSWRKFWPACKQWGKAARKSRLDIWKLVEPTFYLVVQISLFAVRVVVALGAFVLIHLRRWIVP